MVAIKSIIALTLAVASLTMAAPVTKSATTTTTSTATATSTSTAAAHATGTDAPVTIAEVDTIFASDVQYTGRGTWFTDSYGACNIKWDGESEPIVALSATLMGEESWSNPACGRQVRVTSNGKSVTARVVDKCPAGECARGSLDLSPAAFRALAHQDAGVIPIAWNFV